MEIINKIKTYQLNPDYMMSLIQVSYHQFEIRINSKVKVVESDYNRICERFENLKKMKVKI